MRWGVRRYQKKDGSLTDLGKKRINEALNFGLSDTKVRRNKLTGKMISVKNKFETKNRLKAGRKYDRDNIYDDVGEFEDWLDKNPKYRKNIQNAGGRDDRDEAYRDTKSMWNQQYRSESSKQRAAVNAQARWKKMTEDLIVDYSHATLKDLGLQSSVYNPKTGVHNNEAYKYVENIVKQYDNFKLSMLTIY